MAGTVILSPISSSNRLAAGLVSWGTFIGAGAQPFTDVSGWQVADATALTADAPLMLLFEMPDTIPSGTLKLRAVMVTPDNTAGHVAKFTVADAAAAASTDFSSTALTTQSQTTVTIPAAPPTSPTLVTDVTLSAAPAADGFVLVVITFNDTGFTISDISTWIFSLVWV